MATITGYKIKEHIILVKQRGASKPVRPEQAEVFARNLVRAHHPDDAGTVLEAKRQHARSYPTYTAPLPRF